MSKDELSHEMLDAVERTRELRERSFRVDRRGWTRAQWVEDAEKIMNEPDASVLCLANGHVMALLDELRVIRVRSHD
jgi:hypothetical protein